MFRVKIRQIVEYETTVNASSIAEACEIAVNAPFDNRDAKKAEVISVESILDNPDGD